MVGGILSSPDMSACCFLLSLVTFAGDASGPSVSGALLSLVADDGSLSTIFGHLLSLVADDSPLSTILSYFLSAILSCLLSPVIGDGLLSIFSGSGLLFLVLLASS